MKILSIFLLLFSLTGCEKDDEVYSLGTGDGAGIGDYIRIISLTRLQVEADGTSVSSLELKIHAETDSLLRDISLHTSVGNFLNGRSTDTVRADATGRVSVSVLSNTPGIAIITARVKTVVVDTTVIFTPALPDDMLISADNYLPDTTQNITIVADLYRNPGRGMITDPVKVFFSVSPANPLSQPLIYPAFALSTNKKAEIIITNPFKTRGQVTVQAKTLSALGDTIRRNLFFVVQ